MCQIIVVFLALIPPALSRHFHVVKQELCYCKNEAKTRPFQLRQFTGVLTAKFVTSFIGLFTGVLGYISHVQNIH